MRTVQTSQLLDAHVAGRRVIAPGTVSLDLRASESSSPLPAWTAGAHIDVHTPHGVRNYSLCGNESDRHWSIAVRRDDEGGGGSVWLHDHVTQGSELTVGVPRNTFVLEPAPEYLFIAGGIGITPLMPMIHRSVRDGARWRLLYSARDEGGHAFAEDLANHPQVTLWSSSVSGRLTVGTTVREAPSGTLVYCCGPDSLMDAVEATCAESGLDLRTERFSGRSRADDEAFTIELAGMQRRIVVPADRSALEVLNEEGVFVPSSCRAGHCGTCEVPVSSGDIEHRDDVLTDEERAAGDCMFPCVSRARGHVVVEL